MSDQEMDKISPEESETSVEVLVDDLADEGDYWLSITDAARVTRRQEITIRRWIASGALPVRRQRMGPNKRTRHIRASDLSSLTPIIDPLAAITGAPANADLMSIPQQQAQLAVTQQDQALRLTQLHEQLIEFEQDLLEMREKDVQRQQEITLLRQEQQVATQMMMDRLQETEGRWNQLIIQQQQVIETLSQATQAAFKDRDAALAKQMETLLAQIDQMREDTTQQQSHMRVELTTEFTDHLAHSEETIRQWMQSIQDHIVHNQEQSAQSVRNVQSQIDQSIQDLQHALDDALRQQRREQVIIRQRFQEIERRRQRFPRSRVHRPDKS